jgi:hypothetical protein
MKNLFFCHNDSKLNLQGKTSLGRSGTKWKVNSKMNIKEDDLCSVLCCLHPVHGVDLWQDAVDMVMELCVS